MDCIKQVSTMAFAIFVSALVIIGGINAENSTTQLNQYQLDTSTAKTTDALKTQRTYGKDIQGYTQKEVDLAIKILKDKLYPEKKELEEKIKSLELLKANSMNKGYLWDTPKRGLERQYNDAIRDIKKIQEDLERLNKVIYNQEVIARIRYSVFIKSAIGIVAIGAILGGAIAADKYLNDSYLAGTLRWWFRGGSSEYFTAALRSTFFGEKYNIRPPRELEFWNKIEQRWEPVEENEELAKHSMVKPMSWDEYEKRSNIPRTRFETMEYTNKFVYDPIYKMPLPIRGYHYFWDPIMKAFRATTNRERSDDRYQPIAYKKWFAEASAK